MEPENDVISAFTAEGRRMLTQQSLSETYDHWFHHTKIFPVPIRVALCQAFVLGAEAAIIEAQKNGVESAEIERRFITHAFYNTRFNKKDKKGKK